VVASADPDVVRPNVNQASCPAQAHGCLLAAGRDFLQVMAGLQERQGRQPDAPQKVA
jgi:hypothetical protein